MFYWDDRPVFVLVIEEESSEPDDGNQSGGNESGSQGGTNQEGGSQVNDAIWNAEETVPQIPQTGNDAHIALWIVMLAISAAGAAAFRRRVRKEY